jgi:hypothetical protein
MTGRTLLRDIPDGSKVVLAFWAWPGDLPFPSLSLSAWIPDRIIFQKDNEGRVVCSCPGSDDPVALFRWLADRLEAEGWHGLKFAPPQEVGPASPDALTEVRASWRRVEAP